MSIANWNEAQVSDWLKIVGLDEYCDLFFVNDINGEVLLQMDHEILKELQIQSVGKRVLILKAIKSLTGSDPKDEQSDSPTSLVQLESSLKDKDILILELQKQLLSVKSDLQQIQNSYSQPKKGKPNKEKKPSSNREQKHPKSPKKAKEEPQKNKSLMISVRERLGSLSDKKKIRHDSGSENGVIRIYGNSINEYENYKTFAVTSHENCQQILQTAIKKFGIAGDWRKYTLFLHFREKERSLRYNEYPLLLKRQLCDDEEPTFSIRHIRQFDDLESIHSSRESISLKRNNSNKNHQPQGGSTTNLYAQDNSSLDSIEKLMGLEETPQVALGIYEYVAVLDDEVSISIGESVKVLRRATGWWYVENPLGFFGWTPSGCLDLVEKKKSPVDDEESKDTEFTVCEGNVLYDYKAEGANELTIQKGEKVIVRSKHQHWLLADLSGRRGWVPSCYVSIEGIENDDEWHESTRPQQRPRLNSRDTLDSPDDEKPRPSLENPDEPRTEEEFDYDDDLDDYYDDNEGFIETDDSTRDILEDRVQSSRKSVQRLSVVVDQLPKDERGLELRSTIKQLLEDIDEDLCNLPTDQQSLRNSANQIKNRLSKMVRELEILEHKCTLSIPSSSGKTIGIRSSLQALSEKSSQSQENQTQKDVETGKESTLPLKYVQFSSTVVSGPSDQIKEESANVQEWESNEKDQKLPPPPLNQQPQQIPQSPRQLPQLPKLPPPIQSPQSPQSPQQNSIKENPLSPRKPEAIKSKTSMIKEPEVSEHELQQKMKSIGRRNLVNEENC